MKWWEDDVWAGGRPMDFGSAPDATAPRRRVAVTTDPEMFTNKQGQLRLRLVNRHPHERLRIFVGARQTARC